MKLTWSLKNFKIETIGSLSQITRPCPIKYISMKLQHPQVHRDMRKLLTKFVREGHVNLKRCEEYNITDMAVTSDKNYSFLIIVFIIEGYSYTRTAKPMKVNYCLTEHLKVLL